MKSSEWLTEMAVIAGFMEGSPATVVPGVDWMALAGKKTSLPLALVSVLYTCSSFTGSPAPPGIAPASGFRLCRLGAVTSRPSRSSCSTEAAKRENVGKKLITRFRDEMAEGVF